MVNLGELPSRAGFVVTRGSVPGIVGCVYVAEDGASRGALESDMMGDTGEADDAGWFSVAATVARAGNASAASVMPTGVEF